MDGLFFIRNVTGGDMVPGGALRLFFQKMSTDADGTLLFNLVNIRAKRVIYGEFGLDWKWIRNAVRETFNDDVRWSDLKEGTNAFRILVRTLVRSGDHYRPHPTCSRWLGRYDGARF